VCELDGGNQHLPHEILVEHDVLPREAALVRQSAPLTAWAMRSASSAEGSV
jgi:hypothetical protein